MKAIIISKPGDSSVLTIETRPVPKNDDDEVLVRVMAAGINRPDIAQRKGKYPAPPGVSNDIPGLEIAGTIERVGKDVRRWKTGESVCALVAGGGYAQYCAVPSAQCLPIPRSMIFSDAASLPETFFTVWHNVFERGHLQSGESLLVHGGSSGIGVSAIQIAKAFDAHVYVTAGSQEKCRFCEDLGADKAVNYNEEDFLEEIRQTTFNKGVDVILDMVGGDYTPRNLELLSDDGRLVLINFMRGNETTINLAPIMRKRLTITGSTLRGRDKVFKARLASEVEKFVWPKIEEGLIRPVVCKTFLPEQVAAAHDLMESSGHMGKLVITMEKFH